MYQKAEARLFRGWEERSQWRTVKSGNGSTLFIRLYAVCHLNGEGFATRRVLDISMYNQPFLFSVGLVTARSSDLDPGSDVLNRLMVACVETAATSFNYPLKLFHVMQEEK